MGWIKRNAFPVVTGALLAVLALVGAVTNGSQNDRLNDQRAQITDLTAQVQSARTHAADLEQQASLVVSGASPERVERDTEILGELVTRAMTWEDHAQYVDARLSVMRVYALAEDSTFMESFLPVAPVNTDAEGNEYPYIDAAGLNSSVGDVQVKVLSVNGLDYEYMLLVDVRATSSDGRGTAVNVATVFATVDGDGAISRISGFASTSDLLTEP